MAADFPEIPDEKVRLHELRIVVFLDPEGNETVKWDWADGDSPSISHAVGLLEITKLLMIDETDVQDG